MPCIHGQCPYDADTCFGGCCHPAPSASPAHDDASGTGEGPLPTEGTTHGSGHLSTASPSSTSNLALGEGPPDRTCHSTDPAAEPPAEPRGRGYPGWWTPERDAELRERWKSQTADQIAAEMGATSRNAVIGRVNRIGLAEPRRRKPKPKPTHLWKPRTLVPSEPKALAAKTPRKPAPRKLKVVARARPAVAPAPCELQQFTNRSCRYPLGNMLDPPRLFCGVPEADLAGGMPYCPQHAAICFCAPRGRLR